MSTEPEIAKVVRQRIEEVEAAQKNTGESEQTLRWAIVSTATIADKVFPGLKDVPNSQVNVIASRDQQRAEAWATDHGVENACTYGDLLARSDIDACYIPLPSGLRNKWMIDAANAGKHVYAEKPFAGTVPEFKEVIDACDRNNVQFMDGTMWVHSPRTKVVESLIRNNDIGKVKRVTAAFTFKAPNDEWLHGGNGRTDKTREPMGCLGDQGWYCVNAILLAYQHELPTHVMATYTNFNKVDTIISCGATLWFSDGRMATFDCGAEMAHRSQVEIVGEAGVIKIDDLVGGQGRSGDFAAYEKPFVGSDTLVVGDVMGADVIVKVPACDHVNALVQDFKTGAQASEGPNKEWPARSLAYHTVLAAVFESATNGGTKFALQ
jgi:predicted dehydrogenase